MAEQSTTSNRQNHAAASMQLQCCEFFGKPQCRRQCIEVDKCIEGRQCKSRAMTRCMRNLRLLSTVQDLGIQRGLGDLLMKIGRAEQPLVRKDKHWKASAIQCLVQLRCKNTALIEGERGDRFHHFLSQISYKKVKDLPS